MHINNFCSWAKWNESSSISYSIFIDGCCVKQRCMSYLTNAACIDLLGLNNLIYYMVWSESERPDLALASLYTELLFPKKYGVFIILDKRDWRVRQHSVVTDRYNSYYSHFPFCDMKIAVGFFPHHNNSAKIMQKKRKIVHPLQAQTIIFFLLHLCNVE